MGEGYPYWGIILSNKQDQTNDTLNNLDKSQGNYAEGKNPIPKG